MYGDQPVPMTLPELQRISNKAFRYGLVVGVLWGILAGVSILGCLIKFAGLVI